MYGEAVRDARGIVQRKLVRVASSYPLQYGLSEYVLSDCLMVIRYFVMGEPLSYGACQVRMTSLAITEVTGGYGSIGTNATRSSIESE